MRIHIVQKGDTLWKLAQKYGVNFEELKAANTHLSNPDLIMPGMKIKIPSGSVQAKKEAPIQKEAPIKEAPMKEKTPPPSIKEEKEVPITMPTQPKVQPPSYHLKKTNMQFNIYKEQPKQPKVPAPPKMPKPKKEAPIVKEKPKMMPVEKKPEVQPKPKAAPKVKPAPIVKPAPAAKKPVYTEKKPMPVYTAKKPLPADCYPVTPVYHQGYGYCPPHMGHVYGPHVHPGYQGHAHGPTHGPMHGGVPMEGQMPPYPTQAQHPGVHEGNVPEVDQHSSTPNYGDITPYQAQAQPTQYYPTHGAAYPSYGYPYAQPGYMHGHGPLPQQPGWREDDDEENNN